MNSLFLSLFEYEKKPISSNRESKLFHLTPREIEKLENLNEKIRERDGCRQDIICFNYRAERACEIESSSYVGIIKIGHKTIQIIPKLARAEEGSSECLKESLKNLLYMLSYTKKLKISEADIASLTQTNDDFYEILIHLFAKNLLEIIQNDLNKQYVTREENLNYFKGKLNLANHLRKNHINRQKFYLQYDEFCEDTLLNQIFKYTVELLIKSTKNVSNNKLLQELKIIFNDVDYHFIRIEDFSKIILTRLSQQYAPVMNLAKVFIAGSSIKMNSDKLDTFSFLFDMNVLFEEFIGEFIKKECRGLNDSITLQSPKRNLVEKKYKGNKLAGANIFSLKPDIQIYSENNKNNPRTIIDTKYKVALKPDERKCGVSQSDLYQMYAYSKKYNCKNIVLLYPESFLGNINDVKFVIDKDTSVFIKTVNIRIDIKKHKSDLKSELISIINLSEN